MQLIPLSSVQHLSSVRPCLSSRCLSTASFINANMHFIALSQYSIFQQCYHAHHPAVLSKEMFHQCNHAYHLTCVNLLSVLPTSSRCLNTAFFPQCNHAHHLAVLSTSSFNNSTMHIIPLSSVQHLSLVHPCLSSRCLRPKSFISASMHIISLFQYSIFQQCSQIMSPSSVQYRSTVSCSVCHYYSIVRLPYLVTELSPYLEMASPPIGIWTNPP